MKIIIDPNRCSESAIPSRPPDPAFSISELATTKGTRNSLVYLNSADILLSDENDIQEEEKDSHSQYTNKPTVGFNSKPNYFSDHRRMEETQYVDLEEDDITTASRLSQTQSLHSNMTSEREREEDPYIGIDIQVKNHSLNSKGVVMYHVDIKGPQGLLSTYTIRRRYTAFKALHTELTRLLNEYYRENITQLQVPNLPIETGSLLPPFSVSGFFAQPNAEAQNRIQTNANNIQAQMMKMRPPPSSRVSALGLPPLPSAGVWTYLKRHDYQLVEQRKKRFEDILQIAIRHPATKHSPILEKFLSFAPSIISQRGPSYVSLEEYSVPVFDRNRESIERKRRKQKVLTLRQRSGSDQGTYKRQYSVPDPDPEPEKEPEQEQETEQEPVATQAIP